MFWPFSKWATAPAPYDARATSWPVALGLRTLPWELLQSGNYPKRYGMVQSGVQSVGQQPPAFFLPSKVSTAKSGVATSGAYAMLQAQQHIANVARSALMKQAQGLVLSYEEAQVLLQHRLPGPQRPFERKVGTYDVPPNPSATAPTSSAQMIAKLLPPGAMLGRGDGAVRADRVVAQVRTAAVIKNSPATGLLRGRR